jgi:Predicted membrane protein (DUF2142)
VSTSLAEAPRRLPLRLLVGSYAILITSWVVTNPPGAAPDEPAHMLKALAVSGGDLLGKRPLHFVPSGDAVRDDYARRSVRVLRVPPTLAPSEGLTCNAFQPEVSSGCLRGQTERPGAVRETQIATYAPYLYLLPGLAARLGNDPLSAMMLARATTASICFALLCLAACVLWSEHSGGLSIVGLVAAVTPMVVFLSSQVSTSGPEAAACISFLAALLRLTRAEPPPRIVWTTIAAAGATLSLSRSLGPLWIAVAATVFAVSIGCRAAVARMRAGGRRSGTAVIVVGCSLVASIAWEVRFQAHPKFHPHLLPHFLAVSVDELPGVARQWVGVFGWLDTDLPWGAYAAWGVMIVILVTLAFAVGSRRDRWILTTLVAAVPVLTVAIASTVLRQTAFGVQGRYVLGVVAGIPLFAAEVLLRERALLGRLRIGGVGAPVALVAAIVQGVAWYTNARRYAVGIGGPLLFFKQSDWSPLGNWAPWMLVVSIGTVALALSGATTHWNATGDRQRA